VPFSCAALPPLLAIARWRAGSIDANPRLLFPLMWPSDSQWKPSPSHRPANRAPHCARESSSLIIACQLLCPGPNPTSARWITRVAARIVTMFDDIVEKTSAAIFRPCR
jgi:hypothetical protein